VDITLRPATDEDEEFLFALFDSARGVELAMLPEPLRTQLMKQQFAGQMQTYAARYSSREHQIILVDGDSAGRVWVHESDTELRVVDIALLPEYRSRGIGGSLYRDLLDRAASAGKAVRCAVASNNPGSYRFHERLGFHVTSQDGIYTQMEWGGR
jgi:ribosomal protein S18 acetylase RimI-like enzyme